jgi:sensor domain CHASE-containing protein/signal transduction histidine kinase
VHIRPKVIAWIGAVFVLFGVAEFAVNGQIIMPSFAELERADARTAMRRIQYAFDQSLERLGVLAIDWGNWTLVYRFMQDRNTAVVEGDINDANVREIGVNLVQVLDLAGNVVYSRTVDLPAGQSLDFAKIRSLPQKFPWRANLHTARPVQGLLPTNLGVFVLAAAPILDGDGRGPSRGMLILGRLLKSEEIDGIAAQAQTHLTALPAPVRSRPDRLTQTGTLTHVDRDLLDIYGRPIMTLRIDVPREITARGHKAALYGLAWQVIAAVAVLTLLLAVLSRTILNPLAAVTRHALVIGADKDLTSRLELRRNDEIGVLAREFDRMVERVADSRRQLIDQSFDAGFAELARGVLHNLGNAMTPIGVRLANVEKRLRDSAVADAVQAAAELESEAADAQRRAELLQFLHLACKEVAGTVRATQDDVAIMMRQADTMRSILAEQMRMARNEHVIEAVKLTELVAQSLEIVPDMCRQRLLVDCTSLRSLGVVRVARTVLRLVLQNLIINAADAVRDAGKERGALRFSAQIVHGADTEQLHLTCTDNGIGISAENLKRIFDKGFSTKSFETNQGIGLHWCANAINALGGRIWAESDGPGRGASIHVLMPLAGRESVLLAGVA